MTQESSDIQNSTDLDLIRKLGSLWYNNFWGHCCKEIENKEISGKILQRIRCSRGSLDHKSVLKSVDVFWRKKGKWFGNSGRMRNLDTSDR